MTTVLGDFTADGAFAPIAGAFSFKPITDNDLIFRRIIFRLETNTLWHTVCSPDGRDE